MAPSSQKLAKAQGVRFYFTGRPCKRGHIEPRYASGGACVECANLRAGIRYKENRDTILSAARAQYKGAPAVKIRRVTQRRAADPEKAKREKRAEYRRHKPSYIKRAAKWAKTNPDKMRIFRLHWVKNNPDAAYQVCVDRRFRLNQRSPEWLTESDRELIRDVYAEARQVSKDTGVPHQVDHIIPIRGKLVSGLHVPGNLQVLTAFSNQSKGNRFTPS